MKTFRSRLWALAPLATLALLTAAGPAARADHIDERLLSEAPKIMKYLKDHKFQTVGVVKFSVRKGAAAPSMNAGTLNTMMANRLEHALVLLNDPKQPLNILEEVSKNAAGQSRGATARSVPGRRSLLEHSYPLAWGNDRRQPDVLLTGEVQLSKDMKKATILVQAFDKKKPDQVTEVLRIRDVPTDRNVLASAGQSFVVPRGTLRKGARDADEAALNDAANRDNPGAPPVSGVAVPPPSGTNPLQDPNEPVKLDILYDGQPVPIEADASSPGELRIRRTKAQDPKEGQKVKFVITNTSTDTVGVVLAINGKNVLFQEDLTTMAPGACHKVVLGPNESQSIEGFYMSADGKDFRPFNVLSDEASAKIEMAPEHKGVFAMFVFREGSGALNIAGPEAAELSRKPKQRGATAQEATANVARANRAHRVGDQLVVNKTLPRPATRMVRPAKGGRGLVDAGEPSGTGSALNRVENKFDPQPAASLFIRYYQTPTPPMPPPAN